MRSLSVFAVASVFAASALEASPQERIAEPSTPEARATLDRAAACLVKESPKLASEMLATDFRTPEYRRRMDFLVDANRTCIKARWIRTNRLLMAGALAEHLIEREKQPLNARLAGLPASSPVEPRSPSDAAVFCVARSDPDGTARLLATAPGTPEEIAAAQALAPALGLCMRGRPMSVSPAGLRSMIATASFRLLAAAEGAS